MSLVWKYLGWLLRTPWWCGNIIE